MLVVLDAAWCAEVRLLKKDATVWSQRVLVRGTVSGGVEPNGLLSVNGDLRPVVAAGGMFEDSVAIGEGTTAVVASFDSAGVRFSSDTLHLTLGYRLRPDAEAAATVSGSVATLRVRLLENSDNSPLAFSWSEDPRNPIVLGLENGADSVARVTFPGDAPAGEYTFSATIAASDGDTVVRRACLVADSSGIRPMAIATDHAGWIDSAIVYGITPYVFVQNGTFRDITAKLREIAGLGVNTLWIQPVYATERGGQGYDVTDYFRVRGDLGSEADVLELVQAAHAHGLRVLFDFVPNHSSIFHPYAVQSSAEGTLSHYYDFYQREVDSAPYSRHYHSYEGFINYFWNELPNFNYDNPELRRMIIEAGRHWVEHLGIDGYRVDAVWGVNARRPEFMKEWRLALKRIRPDLLLLAEDKATWPTVFDERFDAAYDWAPEEDWVSHWVWQTYYSTTSNPTIFNHPQSTQRSALLRAAMTNSGNGYSPKARILRFMENNDTFRFLPTHDAARTRMVAAMMFTVPGIPLVFNGQEIGATQHPYQTHAIFSSGSSIESQDQSGLYGWYRRLCGIRKRHASLTGVQFSEIPVTPPGAVYAYRRWAGRENILVLMNMASSLIRVNARVPVADMDLDSARGYFLNELLTDQSLAITVSQLDTFVVDIPAYTTRVYLLDTAVVSPVEEPPPAVLPGSFALDQNYPNPFNPATTIVYQIGSAGRAKLAVYDILGREVRVLLEEYARPGRNAVTFDGSGLASGVYLCRLEAGAVSLTRKMILLQ